jgi:hypothetical protein
VSLIPFSAKAFNVDDTLFLFAAKQIVKQPLDPYGFQLVWNKTAERMADVTMNPPLACYYAALAGRIAGWSERALHLAFFLPALAVVLGTYRLASRCTRYPLLAALATLLTPGVLVSATSVMCDTLMVALWIWAVILWIDGLEPVKPFLLLSSSLLIAASAMAKYFGIALIPLLLVYSLVRLRRVGWWAAYFVLPIVALAGYEVWTARLYGQGLIAGAAEFAGGQRAAQQGSTLSHALVSLSFSGGCALTALMLTWLLWRRKQIVIALGVSMLGALSLALNWVDFGAPVGGLRSAQSVSNHWVLIAFQLSLCIVSGVSILAMGVVDVWENRRNAESWLLALWVIGTWIFAGFMNWTVNARSVLPLIPAAGILIFRRVERSPRDFTARRTLIGVAAGLAVAGILSFWISASDAAWANSQRQAADLLYRQTRGEHGTVYFAGHWGFQYYMQSLGFVPADEENSPFQEGDLLIVPIDSVEIAHPRGFDVVRQPPLELLSGRHASTMCSDLGAGFYSSYWGPLPFVFGKIPEESYYIFRLVPKHHRASSPAR